MPDAESFVAAVAANPADDLPRLVFADWLDENGDPARAGFIRDHVRLAKLRPGSDEYKTLFRKCADTLRANLPAWIKPACDAFGQPAEWKPEPTAPPGLAVRLGYLQTIPLSRVELVRGFIRDAEIDLRRVKDSAAVAALFRQQPVTRVKFSLPPMPADVRRTVPPHPLPVRSLRLSGSMHAENLDITFALPALAHVTDFAVSSGHDTERFVRSPMARQLTSLQVPPDQTVFQVLMEYPLDDRLETLTVWLSKGKSSRRVPENGDRWPALSRVSFRPTLKRLDLTRCGMTDDGLAAFARGEEWVRLQGLKLGGNLFGDRGWADFCRGWRTPELTYLDASRNRLSYSGAEMLARSGMLKTLRVIDLRGNRIAGRGAVALARAVAEGKLTKLLLAGNPLHKRDATTVKGLLGERTDLASGAT